MSTIKAPKNPQFDPMSLFHAAREKARAEKLQRQHAKKAAPAQEERPAWMVSPEELSECLAQQKQANKQVDEALEAAATPAPTPKPLPDYWQDVQGHLERLQREGKAERRQQSTEYLADVLTPDPNAWATAPAPAAKVQQRPQHATAAELRAEVAPVSPQAADLHDLLHELALTASHHAGKPKAGQGVVYTSQELLGEALGRSRFSIIRYADELEAAGLLVRRKHYGTLEGRTVTDGTLYAVQTRAGHTPELGYSNLKKQYRNLDQAKASGTTFFAFTQHLQQSLNPEGRQQAARRALFHFAVNPQQVPTPVNNDCCKPPSSVWDVVYSLPDLLALVGAKLAEAIGRTASALGHAFNDQHSRRYWCSQLWKAVRSGRVQQLQAALERVLHDVEEWPELRNPAALFAARQILNDLQ